MIIILDPCYTDFISESEDFTVMSVPYSPEMKAFYQAIRNEMVKNKGIVCRAPMVFWGKYVNKEGKLMLPVTLQVRHSVCDGYHAAKFFMDMEKAIPEVMEELS